MGRSKKDPNAEATTLTVSGGFEIRITATELIPDSNGEIIAWKGSGEFVNPHTEVWEKIPQGTHAPVIKLTYNEGEEKKKVNVNCKDWLDFLKKDAEKAERKEAAKKAAKEAAKAPAAK